MKGRRANGEGSVYEFIQKIKKDNTNLSICETCKNCNSIELCNNREDCKRLCDKCKNCTDCLKYCDRYYCLRKKCKSSYKKRWYQDQSSICQKKKRCSKK